jgi:hypothetical protein
MTFLSCPRCQGRPDRNPFSNFLLKKSMGSMAFGPGMSDFLLKKSKGSMAFGPGMGPGAGLPDRASVGPDPDRAWPPGPGSGPAPKCH